MVRDADHVIVLAAGEVVEEGTPEELVAKGGWFAGFANSAEEDQPEEENEQEDDVD